MMSQFLWHMQSDKKTLEKTNVYELEWWKMTEKSLGKSLNLKYRYLVDSTLFLQK